MTEWTVDFDRECITAIPDTDSHGLLDAGECLPLTWFDVDRAGVATEAGSSGRCFVPVDNGDVWWEVDPAVLVASHLGDIYGDQDAACSTDVRVAMDEAIRHTWYLFDCPPVATAAQARSVRAAVQGFCAWHSEYWREDVWEE